jgi:hypothetical protein
VARDGGLQFAGTLGVACRARRELREILRTTRMPRWISVMRSWAVASASRSSWPGSARDSRSRT